MDVKAEVLDRLNDIVCRIRRSHLTLTVDEVAQLKLPESLREFLLEILELSQNNQSLPQSSPSLQEMVNLGVKEIEQISASVEVAIRSREQKIVVKSVGTEINFFLPPTPAAPQVTELSQKIKVALDISPKLEQLIDQLLPNSRSALSFN